MAQKLILFIGADGVPTEHTPSTDDITFNSFTAGAGPVMSPTGIDMNGTDVSDISDLVFTDPSVGTVNQTAGVLVVDNIMAKERNNVMAVTGAILFGAVADAVGEVDSFKVPNMSVMPTATPAFSADQGYLVSASGSLWIWTGTEWNDLGTAESAASVQNLYTAGEDIDAAEAVYISANDTVMLTDVSGAGSASRCMGFASSSVLDTNPLYVQSEGVLAGFSGLTAGARYYLNPAVPGGITSTIPVGSGNTIVQAGYSKNATNLHIHIEQLGRRS